MTVFWVTVPCSLVEVDLHAFKPNLLRIPEQGLLSFHLLWEDLCEFDWAGSPQSLWTFVMTVMNLQVRYQHGVAWMLRDRQTSRGIPFKDENDCSYYQKHFRVARGVWTVTVTLVKAAGRVQKVLSNKSKLCSVLCPQWRSDGSGGLEAITERVQHGSRRAGVHLHATHGLYKLQPSRTACQYISQERLCDLKWK
jgi:hypothetical protein